MKIPSIKKSKKSEPKYMGANKRIRVIIDTNLFISFLIGKRLATLKETLNNSAIELILSNQHILELKLVTSRSKFKKYFNQKDVNELIDLLFSIGKVVHLINEPDVCRDSKDNFLLGLADNAKADYLVSGDKDLLEMVEYKKTKIVTANSFEKILNDINPTG